MYENEEKRKLVKKELNKIKKLYKEIDQERKKTIEKLAENAAWMAVSLEELRQKIDEKGYEEEYTNGANQTGTKESVSVSAYNKMMKNYNMVIKLLLDQLPKSEQAQVEDKLATFLIEGKRKPKKKK